MASIGAYVLEDEIGRGGAGRVYRARHVPTGAVRALKVLAGGADAEALLRFRREAEVLARVAGTGVVPVHDAGIERGQPWFSMAYLAGGSLRGRLRREQKLPWREAATLGARLARILDRCHAAGVVHRDLKPDNVLLDDRGEPWVADFGAVRDLEASVLTQSGATLGTVAYMSPEQIDARPVDARADVYALAVVVHELVAGERPYGGASPLEQLRARQLPRARLVAHGAPPALDDVLDRALAFDPARRTASALDFASELEAVLSGQAPAARSPSKAGPASRVPVVAGALLAAALLVTLAVGGGLAVASRARPSGDDVASPTSGAAVHPAREARAAEREAEGDERLRAAVLERARGALAQARAAYHEAQQLGSKSALDKDRLARAIAGESSRDVGWLETLSPETADLAALRPLAPVLYAHGVAAQDFRRFHEAAWRLAPPAPDVREPVLGRWRAFVADDPDGLDLELEASPAQLRDADVARLAERLEWGLRLAEASGHRASDDWLWRCLKSVRRCSETRSEIALRVLARIPRGATRCYVEAVVAARETTASASAAVVALCLEGCDLLPPAEEREAEEVGRLADALIVAIIIHDGHSPVSVLPRELARLERTARRDTRRETLAKLGRRLLDVGPDARLVEKARALIQESLAPTPPSNEALEAEVALSLHDGRIDDAVARARAFARDRPGGTSRRSLALTLETCLRWSEITEIPYDDRDLSLGDGFFTTLFRALVATGQKDRARALEAKLPGIERYATSGQPPPR